MPTYAKIRQQYVIGNNGKRQLEYVVELRDIEHNAEIISRAATKVFNNMEDIIEFTNANGYRLIGNWRTAEKAENIYRDGAQNIYRSRKPSPLTDSAYDAEADRRYFILQNNPKLAREAQSIPDTEREAWWRKVLENYPKDSQT